MQHSLHKTILEYNKYFKRSVSSKTHIEYKPVLQQLAEYFKIK